MELAGAIFFYRKGKGPGMALNTWTTGLLSVGLFATFNANASASSSITAKEAAAKVQAGEAVLIDVRETDELKYGKATPALSLPLSEVQNHSVLSKKIIDGLDHKKLVIVYCVSGARSQKVATELETKGFKTANLGSFKAWQDAGLPITK